MTSSRYLPHPHNIYRKQKQTKNAEVTLNLLTARFGMRLHRRKNKCKKKYKVIET